MLENKNLKYRFFISVKFSLLMLVFAITIPAKIRAESIGVSQQAFSVAGFSEHLTQLVKKPSINIDICGAGLPALPALRLGLQNDFQNALLAWIEPMRIFGASLTRNIDIGFCGSNIRTTTKTKTVKTNCEFDIETRRVICDTEQVTETVQIPADLRVIIETTIPPSNRSNYSSETKTIHLFNGSGFMTILHEVGHAFNLADTYAEGGFFCDIHHDRFAPSSTSVMCNANFINLQLDDIAGAQHLYCTQFPNDCNHRVLTVENDTDRPGQDYINFDLPTANSRLCYDSCADDNNCKAYTYVPPTVQGPNARCWLKNKLPSSKSVIGMVSGYKP